ncbi:hypothetical protein HY945_03730 [Candidatus Gottesmanbacteria bacterium]|nr:hypothetical protein [Candidatus Gottesmanbacteria bacterium]
MFNKKYFFLGIFIGIILLISYLFTLPDGKLHIVFCNVGQGDAAYIRAPNNQDMLIDGGPDDKVLTCLGKNMAFYDRTIDIVLLTHPQKDHLQGLLSVIQRYNVKYFVIGVEGNETEGYKKLITLLKERKIPIKNLYTGDQFAFGKVKFSVLWPEKNWVASHTKEQVAIKTPRMVAPPKAGTPPMVKESEGVVLGLSTDTELNDFSYFLDLKYGSFSVLFPGDGDIHIQRDVMKTNSLSRVDVLKFPHHGSKTGILSEFLDVIKPKLAIISVGKNSYGHPTNEAMELLSRRAIELKRTDREGDIEIVSDGQNYWSP